MRVVALGLLLAVTACGPTGLTPAQRQAAVNGEQVARPAPPGPIVSGPPGDLSASRLRCTQPTNQNEVVCSRTGP
jgi:hypothetical protein